ncbi:MAG: DUF1566 domain-containing protein, partial [Rhodoferax sp.]|nr:DUF1566 domain-containing protein [Rhodoferax sp.]
WKKGGSNIPGATDSTYTIAATSIADSGAVFSVVVSNDAGSTSSSATLTVNAAVAPAIATQPLAQTVAPGKTVTFTVIATGTTLRYQWRKDGDDISGATASNYAISSTTSANDGAYSVVVSNSAGTVTSSSATLTVSRYSLVANASGFYANTDCVKDNQTGLIWEGKPTSGVRAASHTYTNFDGDGIGQKLLAGAGSASSAEIGAGTNSIGYVNTVNASGLCGFVDWRLPNKDELQGIVDASQSSPPKIDKTWFPNTQSSASTGYVSSSPYIGYPYFFLGISFYDGLLSNSGIRDTFSYVRLVRCDPAATCASN